MVRNRITSKVVVMSQNAYENVKCDTERSDEAQSEEGNVQDRKILC